MKHGSLNTTKRSGPLHGSALRCDDDCGQVVPEGQGETAQSSIRLKRQRETLRGPTRDGGYRMREIDGRIEPVFTRSRQSIGTTNRAYQPQVGIIMKLKAFFNPDIQAPIPSVRNIQAVETRKREASDLRETLKNRKRSLSMRLELELIK